MPVLWQLNLLSAIYISIFINFVALHTSGIRISEIKCNEYTENSQPASLINYLLPPPFNSQKNFTCTEAENVGKYIIGGRDAESGEYPYQVALGFDTKPNGILWGCGGAIISELFILTAAHCIQTRYGQPRHVLMGDTKLTDNEDSKSRMVIDVLDIFTYPDYSAPVSYGDIALVKVNTTIKFSNEVMPACLAQSSDILENNNTWATVSGWGQLGEFAQQSDTMQTVNLTFWNKSDCNSFFSDLGSKRSFPNGVIESQICAGDPVGNKDTCHGDSGSPMVQKHSNRCLYYIIGVTQGGKECGLSSPGIYTNVTSYLDWIEGIVWPMDPADKTSDAVKTILGIPVRKPQ